MSGVRSSYASERPGPPASAPAMSGWVGLLVFGGILLFILGACHLFEGLVALADDSFYRAAPGDLVVVMDYTAWAWLHVVVGILAIAAGTGIFLGFVWARVLGVGIAVFSALNTMVFLPAYPLWGTIVIAFDVLVIYALIVHGREVRA